MYKDIFSQLEILKPNSQKEEPQADAAEKLPEQPGIGGKTSKASGAKETNCDWIQVCYIL